MMFSAQYMAERTLPPIGPLLLTVFAVSTDLIDLRRLADKYVQCILEVFILCFAGWYVIQRNGRKTANV